MPLPIEDYIEKWQNKSLKLCLDDHHNQLQADLELAEQRQTNDKAVVDTKIGEIASFINLLTSPAVKKQYGTFVFNNPQNNSSLFKCDLFGKIYEKI